MQAIWTSTDYKDSWENADVKKWRENCWKLQDQYYTAYEGTQFHAINCTTDMDLLKAKICFALFGMPTQDSATTLLEGYTKNQQKDATAMANTICAQYVDKDKATIAFLPLFICCKMGRFEFELPVFHLTFKEGNHKYVDIYKRVYESWEDFKKNNMFPMMKYCYPKNGRYSCSAESIEYDETKYPQLCFGTTPACDLSARIFRTMDVAAYALSFVSSGIIIVGMFTPLAPAILLLRVGTAVGYASVAWGTVGCIQLLVDKGQHGQSLTDAESKAAWLSIALVPLSVIASTANAALAKGAHAGMLFSTTTRTAVTILNFTTRGLQGGMLALGISSLAEKADKGELTNLDRLQFAMTLFFFANTLMQPMTAKGIIDKARNSRSMMRGGGMNDNDVIDSLERYRADHAKPKNVRPVKKIDSPDKLFKGIAQKQKVEVMTTSLRNAKQAAADQLPIGTKMWCWWNEVNRTNLVNPNPELQRTIDLLTLLNAVEQNMNERWKVDRDRLKRLTSIIPDQTPAEYKQVVLDMIKNATSTKTGVDEGKLRKRVMRITRQLRRWSAFRSNEPKEDSDEDSSDEEDEELKCAHWNICGLGSQFRSATGFIWFIVANRPDVILLNEVKANEKMLADLTTLLGYKYVNHPSVAPNNRYKRGSAILYRMKPNKFTCSGGGSNGFLEKNGADEVETVWADFKLSSGNTYRLVSCYVLKDSVEHFKTAARELKKIAKGNATVIAGDLNMRKSEFLSKWKNEGFIDCLREEWITNVQGTSSSAIDYVLTNDSTHRHVLTHKPVRPIGTNLHLLVPFSVGPKLEDYQWCENPLCFYLCTHN